MSVGISPGTRTPLSSAPESTRVEVFAEAAGACVRRVAGAVSKGVKYGIVKPTHFFFMNPRGNVALGALGAAVDFMTGPYVLGHGFGPRAAEIALVGVAAGVAGAVVRHTVKNPKKAGRAVLKGGLIGGKAFGSVAKAGISPISRNVVLPFAAAGLATYAAYAGGCFDQMSWLGTGLAGLAVVGAVGGVVRLALNLSTPVKAVFGHLKNTLAVGLVGAAVLAMPMGIDYMDSHGLHSPRAVAEVNKLLRSTGQGYLAPRIYNNGGVIQNGCYVTTEALPVYPTASNLVDATNSKNAIDPKNAKDTAPIGYTVAGKAYPFKVEGAGMLRGEFPIKGKTGFMSGYVSNLGAKLTPGDTDTSKCSDFSTPGDDKALSLPTVPAAGKAAPKPTAHTK